MKFEVEIWNHLICKIIKKILKPLGYNKFTYNVFSFFYGLGYKYSFGSIRLKNNGDHFYMEFMPWYFADKKKVTGNFYNRIMLYGAEDFLKMILFFEKKDNVLITSHSNREIAFLINKKLGFKFKKYNNINQAKFLSDSNIFELYIYTKDMCLYKESIKRYISVLKNFENRKIKSVYV